MQVVYAAIDLACNCSEREPFGRTTLEAMASGVPVVCFDDAGVCEIFEQNRGGVRVPAGDEGAFATAIAGYLGASVEREMAGEDARRSAKKTDVAHAYQYFIAALERVSGRAVTGDGALSPTVGATLEAVN
jgi:glycosyltransferase involved in cell wall biosynthesis